MNDLQLPLPGVLADSHIEWVWSDGNDEEVYVTERAADRSATREDLNMLDRDIEIAVRNELRGADQSANGADQDVGEPHAGPDG